MSIDDATARPRELTLTGKVRVVHYVERLRWWPAFVATIALSFLSRGRLAPELVLGLILGALFAMVVSARYERKAKLAEPTPVHARSGGVVLQSGASQIAIAPDEVTRAYAEVHDEGSRVVLEAGHFRRYVLSFDDRGSGRALLRAMRMSALDRPLTFSFFFNMRVTVGADGVLVAWPLLGRRRFIPHGDIERVDAPDTDGVVLHLKSGKTYSISTRTSPGASTNERSALLERLTDAWEAYRAGVSPDALGLLARSGRGTLDWVRALRALGDGPAGGYRGIGLTPDHLWRIAEDTSAPRETRVGAALALRASLDDEGRQRLRVAAASSASPKVRVALEATAEGVDDEEVAARIEGQARAV